MTTHTWDIFCSVVDNFGDIGVCWRLARQLSCELAQSVRLWVDDIESFHRLCRGVNPAQEQQTIAGVRIARWLRDFPRVEPAEFVVEGFGARLPDAYLQAMAARTPPVWINLEYLSAESWVEGCHALPSPHPSLPLVRYFFFPGFTPATGGLLVERTLAAERDAFQNDGAAAEAFWRSLNVVPGNAGIITSLFCYENAALPALIEAWSHDPHGVLCLAPESGVLRQLSAITGCRVMPGTSVRLQHLTLRAVPFLDMDAYDRLLWACDLNFVRGEDSFVRAQLAARPMVWQAYLQDEEAHLAKVAAYLSAYTAGLDEKARRSCIDLNDAWNRQSSAVGDAWPTFRNELTTLATHAKGWAGRLTAGASLAVQLAEFCESKLK
jgi:uncharacterized repeat protein (TIGR03837 family)